MRKLMINELKKICIPFDIILSETSHKKHNIKTLKQPFFKYSTYHMVTTPIFLYTNMALWTLGKEKHY